MGVPSRKSLPLDPLTLHRQLINAAHRRRCPLPHKLHPNNPRPLLLRPLPAPKPNLQHNPAPHLARRPRRPLLEHVPHHLNYLHRDILG